MRPARIVAIVIGTVLALVGAIVVIVGAGALVLAGGDNTIGTGSQRLTTVTAAIASGSAEIEDERPAGWLFDDNDELALRINAEAAAAKPLFLGVGPTDRVLAYLRAVPYDEVDDISFRPFGVDYDRKGAPGESADLPRPGEQPFWTARAVGSAGTVQLDWDYAPGSYTVVLMNADGTRGVEADASLELEVPYLHAGLIVAVVVGGLLLLIGLLLAIFVARSPKAPPAPPASPAPEAAPPPPPEGPVPP
ncbi:MAG TPA: hypothetical protein VJ689_03540, partial [Gaiellaceae bacterium]|nr:hypothetical protein [Gaiellaceae bacterium]